MTVAGELLAMIVLCKMVLQRCQILTLRSKRRTLRTYGYCDKASCNGSAALCYLSNVSHIHFAWLAWYFEHVQMLRERFPQWKTCQTLILWQVWYFEKIVFSRCSGGCLLLTVF